MEGVTFHWHGAHQRGTPGMDGPAMITQCPIPHATTFVYNFEAEPSGTFFWHSHVASHRADGLAGALIVREPLSEDPSSPEYDEDLTRHILFIQEGNYFMQSVTYPEYLFGSGVALPDFLVVNGRGKHFPHKDYENRDIFTPRAMVYVTQGVKSRIRVISNGYTQCRLKVTIDKHRLTLIATDGYPVEPVEFDSVILSGGERFDFVLNANQEIDNYWLRVQGVGDTVCDFGAGICCTDFAEYAIVRYNGAPRQEPEDQPINSEDEIIVNSHFHDDGDNFIELSTLTSLEPYDSPPGERTTYYLSVGVNQLPGKASHIRNGMPQINRITFAYPPGPVLTQSQEMEDTLFCQIQDYKQRCEEEFCSCTQYVKARYNETVELFFYNTGANPEWCHPIHVHGYSVRVVARGRLEPQYYSPPMLEQMDREGMFPRITPAETTAVKDTICVGGSSYLILEFVADNIGWWFVHCHLDYDNMVNTSFNSI
ncbi:Laccase [Holothuria leucospilota]|uniref:Laccase n=1 Tax=Holothuria leucospilota TaxID=206669 RepID=A0A9Q1HF08_HOLLE|nr:Laccase [Holothuria leucospilota]